jgi:hypothetical protein
MTVIAHSSNMPLNGTKVFGAGQSSKATRYLLLDFRYAYLAFSQVIIDDAAKIRIRIDELTQPVIQG